MKSVAAHPKKYALHAQSRTWMGIRSFGENANVPMLLEKSRLKAFVLVVEIRRKKVTNSSVTTARALIRQLAQVVTTRMWRTMAQLWARSVVSHPLCRTTKMLEPLRATASKNSSEDPLLTEVASLENIPV